MIQGIIIFGLNGSGKTTLGKALSEKLDFQHIDIEDYVYKKTEVPYSEQLTREAYIQLMLDDIKEKGNFVMSAVKCNFGEEIASYFTLGIFLDAPSELRFERVERRAYEKFGDRIKVGGDMYESEKRFFESVRKRKIETIEQWMATLSCPIIQLDGRNTVESHIQAIMKVINEKK